MTQLIRNIEIQKEVFLNMLKQAGEEGVKEKDIDTKIVNNIETIIYALTSDGYTIIGVKSQTEGTRYILVQ